MFVSIYYVLCLLYIIKWSHQPKHSPSYVLKYSSCLHIAWLYVFFFTHSLLFVDISHKVSM